MKLYSLNIGLLMGARSLLCAANECSLVVVASDLRAYRLACGEYILYLLYFANTLLAGWLGAYLQRIPTCQKVGV